MWNSDSTGNVIRQISIFKCENGYGIESFTGDPEEGIVRRYVSTELDEAIEFVKSYFKGELDG